MKSWWLVIALLLSVGLNLGILAAISVRRAQPHAPREEPLLPEPERPRPEDGARPENNPIPALPRLADRLRLEGEERRKFLDIQWKLFEETSRLRFQRGEIQRELKRELTRAEPDRRRVDSLLAESARNHAAMERALVNSVLASRELLEPEKEREYLLFVGRLRVPNPGLGLQGQRPEGGPLPLRDRPFRDRMERREILRDLRERRLQEPFPGAEPFPGDEQGPPPSR